MVFIRTLCPRASVLLYINNLHISICTYETYHFADDTYLLNFSVIPILVSWLNANKMSLNANKTESFVFPSPWK